MTDAYKAGRAAFRNGTPREACPFPGPFNPPRSVADIGVDPACDGAFWLDGYEQERDGTAAE